MDSDQNPVTAEELDQQWKDICMAWCREGRDKLISDTDYIHFPDVTIDSDSKASLLTYRQQLRDFPASYETLYDSMSYEQKHGVTRQSIQYPTKPS